VLDAIAAEWMKLRSVRSTLCTLGVVAGFVLLCGLWSWYAARYWDGLAPERRATARAAPAEQPLVLALPICAAVLGALSVTSEYATGMIRTSLAAVPGRGALFAAKAVVAGAVALVAALVSLTVAVALGWWIVGDRPIPSFEGTVTGQVPHLLALAAWAGVIALVGCGLGAVLRSTAGTITVLVGVLLVLPMFAGFLPGTSWGEVVSSVLPLSLPDQIAAPPGITGDPGVLSPAGAIAVLAAYAVAALALGAFSFVRRDA
jgi:ABC-type transport system involved in multi-copper enzyme maturation permease subunit